MRRQTWQASLGTLASLLLFVSTQSACGGSKSSSGGGDDDDDGTKTGTKDASTTSKDGGKPTTYVEGGVTHYSDGAVEYVDGSTIPVGPMCTTNADCTIGLCSPDGTCEPTDNDNEVDGAETDTDCGGALNADGTMNSSSDGAPACKTGKNCLVGYDCVDKVCYTGAAVELSNGGAPVDCPSGATCTCQAPTVTDGVQNDSETDIDCGGKLGAGGVANPNSDQATTGAALCTAGPGATGQHCAFGSDCDQGICNANAGAGGAPTDCPTGSVCTCQAASPDDKVKNGGESDVDCGGNSTDGAQPCANINPVTGVASVCAQADDCVSLHCGASLTCVPATSSDGIKNGGETDIDCGGALNAAGTAAAGSDGAPACPDINSHTAAVSVCALGTDCKSGYCSTVQKICVDGQSCALPASGSAASILDITSEATATLDAKGSANVNGVGEIAGITTCGRGEATDDHSTAAGLVNHDSCCKSLDVTVTELGATASTTVRVDKYEVTSGRMRQFIEAVNALEGGTYNLRKWVKAQFAADGKTPATPIGTRLALQIPTGQANTGDIIDLFPDALSGDVLNLEQQLGGTTMDEGVPSTFQGCYSTTGAAGAGTYFLTAEEQADVARSNPRPFTQDYYDIKSMNCTPYWMAAAFCAWDGGRLTAREEYEAVWGTTTYPWGNDSRLWSDIKSSKPANTSVTDWTINNLNEEQDFYFYPNNSNPPALGAGMGILDTIDSQAGSINSDEDYSPFIAAPGRFIRDVSAKAATGIYAGDYWYDLAANMFEYPIIPASRWVGAGGTFCDTTQNVVTTTGAAGCSSAGGTVCTTGNYQGQTVCGYVRSTQMSYTYWLGGSWEVHGIPGGVDNNAYGEYAMTQYGKAGFRCARAAE